jgi:hypothetical protein
MALLHIMLLGAQGTWQPAGYHPHGYAQPAPPFGNFGGQQNQPDSQPGCGSIMPMIVSGIKSLLRNRQLMDFLKRKFSQVRP